MCYSNIEHFVHQHIFVINKIIIFTLFLCPSSHSLYFITGITLSGLESPLTVGQPATITCTTNIEVSSIEWMDETSTVLNSATDQTVVEYTIPLVRDDLQGLQYTCRAVAGTTIYTETVEIQVVGKCMSQHFVRQYSCTQVFWTLCTCIYIVTK